MKANVEALNMKDSELLEKFPQLATGEIVVTVIKPEKASEKDSEVYQALGIAQQQERKSNTTLENQVFLGWGASRVTTVRDFRNLKVSLFKGTPMENLQVGMLLKDVIPVQKDVHGNILPLYIKVTHVTKKPYETATPIPGKNSDGIDCYLCEEATGLPIYLDTEFKFGAVNNETKEAIMPHSFIEKKVLIPVDNFPGIDATVQSALFQSTKEEVVA